MVRPRDLAERVGEWLKGQGPYADAVVSTRIRLARNLAGRPFPNRAQPAQRQRVDELVRDSIRAACALEGCRTIELGAASDLDRRLLVERHLISKEHAGAEGPRSVCFDQTEQTSIMINEEDHLRIQVIRSGMELHSCWADAERVEHQLASQLEFAFDDKFGYLTSCPTNVGTGMRISIMLHLPALVLARQMEKVFEAMGKINLAVRGLYGEGTSASGDFYQISNQVTLGRDESSLLTRLQEVIPRVISYEQITRQQLLEHDRHRLEDRAWRALGILRTARQLSSEEMMEFLSSVRMGVTMGLINEVDLPTINTLFLRAQPAHLQALEGRGLPPRERGIARARMLRERLA